MSRLFRPPETKIPRRYAQIPKDQEKLLARDDAWSTAGFPNVPNEVLQNLVDFHVQKKPAVSHQQPGSQRPGSRGSSPPGSPRAAPSEEESRQQGEDVEEGSGDKKSTFSWSESDREGEKPRESPKSPPVPSSPQGLPTKPPELPRPKHQAISLALKIPFASSDIGSEAEMEIDPPRAVTDTAEPVRARMAAVATLQPAPTPPSAQVQIVPCSYSSHTSPAKPPERPSQQPARRRRMKPIVFGSSQDDPESPPRTSTIVPETLAPSLQTKTPDAKSPSSNFAVISSNCEQPVPPPAQPPAKRRYSVVESSQDETSVHNQATSSGRLPPNGPASQVPYTAFTLRYPEYMGTEGDFIKSVSIIQNLQQHRALPEFLYDDFVRVFSEDYLEYIEGLDDTSDALTAIQWYNEHVRQPTYTEGFLNRSTLKDVMEAYADEFRSAPPSPSGSTEKSSESLDIELPDVNDNPTVTLANAQDELPRSTSIVRGTGELRSDPIQSSAAPWSSPGRSKEQGEEATDSPLSRSVQQHDRSSPRYQAVDPEPSSPGIQSQVPLDFDARINFSTPSKPQRSPLSTAVATAQSSRKDSIPETAIKPKAAVAHRPSSSATKPSPTQKFKNAKARTEDPASRSARFARFLNKRQKKLQSSAPLSSIAD